MDELVLSAKQALVVPRADGSAPYVFDMRPIFKAEARLVELQGITKFKANELVVAFINACDESKKFLSILNGELLRAKEQLKYVRGIVVLDRAVDVLKSKGLVSSSSKSPAGSEDLRDAVVHTDKEYKEAVDRLAQVTAAAEYMDGKVEKMRMAYFCANAANKDLREVTRDTSGGTGEEEVGAFTSQEKMERFVNEHAVVKQESYDDEGFGAPKF